VIVMVVSSQPRKQRKRHFNAPKHKRQKKVAALLSKELRAEHERRNAPVRVGDTVKIMRGSLKGKSGEVTKVSLKNYILHIKDINATKADGTEVPKPIRPSNVMITSLKLEDDKRKKKFKGAGEKAVPKKKEAEEKPAPKKKEAEAKPVTKKEAAPKKGAK